MLRERPVESALDPEFDELDEIEAELLREAVLESLVRRAADRESRRPAAGRRRGLEPDLLRQAFLRLVEYADVEIVATPCAGPN